MILSLLKRVANTTGDIIKAFNKYRKGSPYEASEPNQEKVITLYQEIINCDLFTHADADNFLRLLKNDNDADIQAEVNRYRDRLVFKYPAVAEQKNYVYLLAKLVKAFNFLSSFYKYSQLLSNKNQNMI